MALLWGALTPTNRPVTSAKLGGGNHLRPFLKSLQVNEPRRRGLLSFLFLSTAVIPEPNDSKNALLQEYLKRSREKKAKNDKERLDDYYKRNYKDYFEFIEGTMKDKNEEQLSESEKGIREWLQKNKK